MKKIALLAALVVLGASFSTATAAKKKSKKKAVQTEEVADCCMPAKTAALLTPADTLSYAAGKTATMGLIPYLQQQLKVDTAYMADFIRGYQEAVSSSDNPQYVAYQAGTQVAQMARKQILNSMKVDFEGSDLALSEPAFHEGFLASLRADNSIYTDSAAQAYFEQQRTQVKEAATAAYRKQNEDWLANNKSAEGVETLPSGLQYKVITMGTGARPLKDQKVKVKYEGRMIDGTVFDSSYKRNPQTSEFRCDQVIKGWTEALQLMPVGSKWELFIPQNLAYGERQAGNIKPYSTLIFTVELVDIVADEAKTDEAKPADAKSDKSSRVAAAKTVARKIAKKK